MRIEVCAIISSKSSPINAILNIAKEENLLGRHGQFKKLMSIRPAVARIVCQFQLDLSRRRNLYPRNYVLS